MEGQKNVEHKFGLSGMQAGDWFFGCRKCWFQLAPRTAARAQCPECRGRLEIYDVTPDDVAALDKH